MHNSENATRFISQLMEGSAIAVMNTDERRVSSSVKCKVV